MSTFQWMGLGHGVAIVVVIALLAAWKRRRKRRGFERSFYETGNGPHLTAYRTPAKPAPGTVVEAAYYPWPCVPELVYEAYVNLMYDRADRAAPVGCVSTPRRDLHRIEDHFVEQGYVTLVQRAYPLDLYVVFLYRREDPS